MFYAMTLPRLALRAHGRHGRQLHRSAFYCMALDCRSPPPSDSIGTSSKLAPTVPEARPARGAGRASRPAQRFRPHQGARWSCSAHLTHGCRAAARPRRRRTTAKPSAKGLRSGGNCTEAGPLRPRLTAPRPGTRGHTVRRGTGRVGARSSHVVWPSDRPNKNVRTAHGILVPYAYPKKSRILHKGPWLQRTFLDIGTVLRQRWISTGH